MNSKRLLRRFPDLRTVPAEFHAEILELARRRVLSRLNLLSISIGMASVIVFLPVGAVVSLFFGSLLHAALSRFSPEMSAMVVSIVGLSLFTGISVGGVSVVCDRVEVVQLRRGIRLVLGRDQCPRCHYSLEGLTPVNGALTCPECSMRVFVRASSVMIADSRQA
jgi:hypothetical protein